MGQTTDAISLTTGEIELAGAWGLEAQIDLHGCDPVALADEAIVRAFVPALVQAISMRAWGPLITARFGQGDIYGLSAVQQGAERTSGLRGVQLIETSLVSLHCDEPGRQLLLNVFSCKGFDPAVAAVLAVAYFGGTAAVHVQPRGTRPA